MPFNKRGGRFRWMLFFPMLVVLITLLLGVAVQLLWNAILPRVVHVNALTYWQAVGLLILCRILFGNFGKGRRGGGPPMGRGQNPLRDKLMRMTPEERERFREEWRNRCRSRR